MTASDYRIGRQPCDNYTPQRDGNPYATWDNVHSCMGPFAGNGHDATRPMCAGTVSFCEACVSDHHAGGYETCPQPVAP